MSNWLERELSRHLGPASAPESLWDRIQNPPEPRRPAALPWARWAAAAVLSVAAAAGAFWLPGRIRFEALRPGDWASRVRPADRWAALPADWTLRCALPNHAEIYQLAGLTSWKSPVIYTVSSTSKAHGTGNCQQCHATSLN